MSKWLWFYTRWENSTEFWTKKSIQICVLVHRQAHMGQMGKCLWHCPTTSVDNSIEVMHSGPWASPCGSKGQMPMMLHNYKSGPFHWKNTYNHFRYMYSGWPFEIWILAPWVNALGSNRLPWTSPYGRNGQMNKLCSTTSWNNSIELQMEKIHHGVSKMYFGQGKAHMGQIGKWPEWCITKGLDNSIELWMVLIYPAV